VSYTWDLNKYPGGTATGATVSATYPHPDTRYVTLTVKDAGGLSSSVTQTILVGSTPNGGHSETKVGATTKDTRAVSVP
jgi:PKD repeat protein